MAGDREAEDADRRYNELLALIEQRGGAEAIGELVRGLDSVVGERLCHSEAGRHEFSPYDRTLLVDALNDLAVDLRHRAELLDKLAEFLCP